MSRFVGNLAALLRLMLAQRAARCGLHVSIDQIVLLMLAGVGVKFLADYLAAGEPPEINQHGLATLAAGYIFLFLSAYLIDRAQRIRRLGRLLVVVLGVALLAHLGVAFTRWLAESEGRFPEGAVGSVVTVVICSLAGAAIWRGVALTYGTGWLRTGLAATLLVLATVAPFFALPDEPTWHDAPSGAGGQTARLNIESTYDNQWSLLRRRLDGLAPQRAGETDLYFIGFAGYGPQDVFLNEVRSAQALFDQRFDTLGHSLTLINHMSTVREVPLASVSNLRDSLNALGRRMDVEEDVLFLYLTSHGSPDGWLVVELANLRLNQLRAERLKRMLDDSGIKWRVLVIAACHAGSFIEPLKDERTLIITAAAADRKSFGCSDHGDWTYFGEALIDQALRRQSSFVSAFHEASRLVAERERREGLTPSRPQMHLGGEIAGKLEAMERRLRAAD